MNTSKGPKDDITGKWKLVKGETFSSTTQELQTEDYSCNTIIYHFHADGTLSISSDVEDYIGHLPDQYTYEFSATSNEGNSLDYSLRIDNRQYHLTMSDHDLTINLNPIDPLAIYLSKSTSYFLRL